MEMMRSSGTRRYAVINLQILLQMLYFTDQKCMITEIFNVYTNGVLKNTITIKILDKWLWKHAKWVITLNKNVEWQCEESIQQGNEWVTFTAVNSDTD